MSNQFVNIILNSITGITLAVFTQYVSNMIYQIKTQEKQIEHVTATVHTIEDILCNLQKRIDYVETALKNTLINVNNNTENDINQDTNNNIIKNEFIKNECECEFEFVDN